MAMVQRPFRAEKIKLIKIESTGFLEAGMRVRCLLSLKLNGQQTVFVLVRFCAKLVVNAYANLRTTTISVAAFLSRWVLAELIRKYACLVTL